MSTEEIELFERIRKHIGNKPSYEEFLKTLNLYTQHILDIDTLINQVSVFIGSNRDLLNWFKNMVGYEPKESAIEKPIHSVSKPDLNTCQTTGSQHESPSYRVVPKEVILYIFNKEPTNLHFFFSSGKTNLVRVEISYVGKC